MHSLAMSSSLDLQLSFAHTQNRKDAIRNSIQLDIAAEEKSNKKDDESTPLTGRRSLLSQFTESEQPSIVTGRRLTRAAFSRTLQQQGGGTRRTAFDIPGLSKLKETFCTIDRSVDGVKEDNILEVQSHADACRMVFRAAGANINETCIPGTRDLSENFCDPKEYLGPTFEPPCTEEQQVFLRRNRNLFTSGEDNLVLRGVNLYGEKQWILIADRYLPDRSVNIISQRYSKLCVMLYKAHGIRIDNNGNLDEPPKLESVDDIDDARMKKEALVKVEPPAILNVHRWSLEEDLTLLKAVPIMGHMWAELGARLIPHRDRGHLRKRYQVLERRVKATIMRSTKTEIPKAKWTHPPHRKSPPSSKQAVRSVKPFETRAPAKKASPIRKPESAPPMSIEKAAASLAFLRPQPIGKMSTKLPTSLPIKTTTSTLNEVMISAAPQAKPLTLFKPTTSATTTFLPSKRTPIKTPTKRLVESHLNTDPTLSRTAFEQLVDGTSEEWSQMSRMKKLLEDDSDSLAVADAISNLAKSGNPELSKLPQMELDTNSLSGLSMLQPEASRQHSSSKAPSGTIMASVLKRASKSSHGDEQATESEPKQNLPAPISRKEVMNPSSNSMESPRKRPPSKAGIPSTPVPVSTPGRPNFFSMSGTPIGLSPGFRPSPGIRNNLSLTPNVSYSPAPSTVMRFMTDGNSHDGLEYLSFELSERSQQELQCKDDPNPPPLTPSKNSFLFGDHATLMENDLEAITALNSLSNSPARSLLKRPGEKSKVEQKSLFATVVGGVKEKDTSRKKLQF